MVDRKVDFIIVGQGIAGSWLAYELLSRHYTILVINHETDNTSSLKAAGLFNPITGRKMVKTWIADQLFANLPSRYLQLEKALNQKFLYQMPIYRPFQNIEEKNDWNAKAGDPLFADFVDAVKNESIGYSGIADDLGGLLIKKTGYVDLPKFISSVRSFLINKGVYQSEMFDYQQVNFSDDKVQYKNTVAGKIIFCEGPNTSNPFWGDLPFKLVRGEVIDMECGLESEYIINKGVFMIPKGDYFTVGSTYDHKNLSFEPQDEGIKELKIRLGKVFKGPYRIREKRAGIRPATFDRKPFIGFET